MSLFRRESSWPLYFFGVIALLIVVAIGWVVLSAVRQSHRVVTELVERSPQELIASYRGTLEAIQQADTTREPGAAAQETYAALVSARVPKELLDDHFKALVQVQAVKSEVAPTVETISHILSTLAQKAATL